MNRPASALLALALVLAIAGASVEILLAPAYTRYLVGQVDSAALAGTPEAETTRLAEEVRAYVAGRSDTPLPATLPDGRPAFDDKAVAHLDDVRDVLALARIATLAALVAAAVGLALLALRGQKGAIVSGLRWAAAVSVGSVAIVATVALADFDWFFAAFHALFFEPGTWQFTHDSLIIRLFPERFWVVTGVAWGALIVLGAALLEVAARVIVRRSPVVDA